MCIRDSRCHCRSAEGGVPAKHCPFLPESRCRKLSAGPPRSLQRGIDGDGRPLRRRISERVALAGSETSARGESAAGLDQSRGCRQRWWHQSRTGGTRGLRRRQVSEHVQPLARSAAPVNRLNGKLHPHSIKATDAHFPEEDLLELWDCTRIPAATEDKRDKPVATPTIPLKL